MTPEAQRTAIAEACGWKFLEQGVYVRTYAPGATQKQIKELGPTVGFLVQTDRKLVKHPCLEACKLNAPDYLSDLNAMHEAEKVLTPEQCEDYFYSLNEVLGLVQPHEPSWIKEYAVVAIATATAAQRAEAFLRTLNLWKD